MVEGLNIHVAAKTISLLLYERVYSYLDTLHKKLSIERVKLRCYNCSLNLETIAY